MNTPEWNTAYSLKSITDFGKLILAETILKIDNYLCDYGDEPIDTNEDLE